MAVDISKFFDSISHDLLKQRWCELLGMTRLPADHFAVYRSITEFRWVDRDLALKALGYNHKYSFYKATKKRTLPEQLCSPSDYKTKIVGAKLVEKWNKAQGIPQGVPISDVLANAVLLQFDIALKSLVNKQGGAYFRYSDDILVIVPGDGRAVRGILKNIERELAKVDKNLEISKDKTEIVCYSRTHTKYRCYQLKPNSNTTKTIRAAFDRGITYLGFRYDGKFVYLRESTITNLRGKIARTCKAVTFKHLNQHKEKDLDWLLERAPIDEVSQKFLQVGNFHNKMEATKIQGMAPFKNMTFWSYFKRAEKVFGDHGSRIKPQIRKVKNHIVKTLLKEIRKKYNQRLT